MDIDLTGFMAVEKDMIYEAEFPDTGSGFFVSLRYMPPDEIRRISQEAASKILVKGGQIESQQDASLETEVARRIVSWRGLTPERAASFIAGLKVEALRAALESDGMAEVPCTDQNKLLLVRKGRGFLPFVDRTATSVENYQEKRLEAEIKN